MRGGRGTSVVRRAQALAVVLLLTAGLCTITGTVAPAPDAAAATVNIGTIQAQLSNHRGVNNGTSGNCITYAPVGTSTSSALVSNPSEAQTAHGRPSNSQSSCPSTLNSSIQSTVGFRPAATTSAQDGVAFPVGKMIHYNNPVYADDRYFTGRISAILGGFTSPNTVGFDWQLDETPNSGGNNCCNDLITFTNQISTVTLTQGGLNFRLVILGFIPVASSTTTCPATPSGTPQNEFSTVEGAQTHACLYASLVQVRTLTVVKTVTGTTPPARSFDFSSSSTLAGSPWSNGTFSLTTGGSETRSLTSGNTVTVTETDPGDDRWSLTGLACTEYNAAGAQVPATWVTANLAARQALLSNVPAPQNAAQPGITCTYTNTYTPKATLTLVKQVQTGSAAPNLWTLTATGSAAPPPSGATVSGPSGSAAVTTQRVPAGSYALTEIGTGAAATGYVQVGDWVCRTAGGAALPVTGGIVTLPDSASATTSANVTCTATNQLAAGSLQISKVVDAPDGAYTGGAGKTFSGSYDCGAGFTGTFSTLTTAAPVVINNIPVGRTCTVTETTPAGGLANASYAWGPASFSGQPATITQNGTASVTITNPVVQQFGTFAVTKTIDGPGGYAGGTGRVFPVAYTCTLTNGPTTAGTVDVTTAQAVSPDTPIPTGSVCSFTETLTQQDGDFSDPSYAWTGSAAAPTIVTIGDNSTAAVTITNSYARETGQLVIAKVVTGDGYVGGTAENFTVRYDCGVAAGDVTVAAGASKTVTVPARNSCAVQELPPDARLLSPGFVWGTPTWSPGPLTTVPANGSVTLTVTNPTVPIFGRVSVTKAITGAVDGVRADAQFAIRVACDNGYDNTFTVGVGGTGTTTDLPVGTTCVVTEASPIGGLVDPSYAWGAVSIPGQPVRIDSSGQVVPVTVANDVVRVTGHVSITKAPITRAGIVDPARTFDIGYVCSYGGDIQTQGTATVAQNLTALTSAVFLGSICTITEDPATLTAPPSATDASWVWLPPTYDPGQNVVVTSATTPVAVTVTNRIQQLTGSFNLTKVVTGAGKDGGYAPGTTFEFDINCTNGFVQTVALADTDSFSPAVAPPVGTQCTIEEVNQPPTGPAFAWRPVQFTGDGVTQSGNSATFTIGANTPQVNAINTIDPLFGSVTVQKQITGQTAGLVVGSTFAVTLNCGPGLIFHLSVPGDDSVTQGDIPVGSTCVATEATPVGGLLDASYAWGDTTYDPVDGTVTVEENVAQPIVITNDIVRVLAPVRVVKSYSGPQGVIDPAKTYSITWSCDYGGGQETFGGTVDVVVDAAGVQVADNVPLTAVCTATEGDLGPPSPDPAFRWLAADITGTTVAGPGPNTVTVANTLTRDTGTVRVQKDVTGATEGYLNLGTGAEDFTLHGQCSLPGQPQIPTRYADGSIADHGSRDIVASVGWTCSGFEDSPGQSLLKDASYAWAPPVITGTPQLAPGGTFVLPNADAVQVFHAENPIVRVTDSFTITKQTVDPNGVVQPTAVFSGGYSCQYGADPAVVGRWSITPSVDPDFVIPDLLLGSVCTVTEDPPATTGLPDGSWGWLPPVIGDPDTVVAGSTGSVTVTNTVTRLFAGLQVTKTVVDPDRGLLAGTTFGGAWQCVQGRDSIGGRFTVPANGSVVAFSPADELVPATAMCTISEDTLDAQGLRDGSFTWGDPTYVPESVELMAGQTATLGVTNTVVRVYSDITVTKDVTGPADGLVPTDRPFTGTISCRYGTDSPIVTTWSATLAVPALRSGVLVGSLCAATEDPPGAGGQPVTGDPSYIWLEPVIGDPVTVTPPTEATPPIAVSNPSARLFGTFRVSKLLTGAVDGIVNPQGPYPMTFSCQPGSGAPITGTIEVVPGVLRDVGQAEQIPINSTCILTEPLDTMPPLRDSAWGWDPPTFTVDGMATPGQGRSLTFTIPSPQENFPEPIVAIGVRNNVTKTEGAWSVTKTSDPPSGTEVQPGSTITYTLTLDSTGTVPVHDVVVTDDLTRVLPFATVVDGSIAAPSGTTAALDVDARTLIWTVAAVPGGSSLALTFQVTVNPGAAGVQVGNVVTAIGDVQPTTCAGPVAPVAPLADLAAAAAVADPCSTDVPTTLAPMISKESTGPAVWDPANGTWAVGYRLVATNPDPANEVPYTLTDNLGFPAGTDILSAAVTLVPDGVTLASPSWNGVDAVAIVQNATLPAGAVHTYELAVTATVPPTTTAASLPCAAGDGVSGSGLFNQVALDSLGSLLTDTACEPVPTVLTVEKQWVINGVAYADGTQPAGFTSAPSLDSQQASWNTDYVGYAPGSTVELGESAQVPTDCTSSATGLGPVELGTALVTVGVTNTVVCTEPVPPTPPEPPVPPVPPVPPHPPLPDTGFAVGPYIGWGIGLIIAGALLLIGSASRPRRLTR